MHGTITTATASPAAAAARSREWTSPPDLPRFLPVSRQGQPEPPASQSRLPRFVPLSGTHSVDVDGELAKLDADGYRPLRADATEAPG